MRTDKDMLLKGVKKLGITVLLMFSAPIILWQAFKNEDHPFYWPVLVVGIVLAILAVYMGFVGIKTITSAFFGKSER